MNIVTKPGFEEFCKKYGVIKEDEKLPHRTTVSRAALGDVYSGVYSKFKALIRQVSQGLGLTLDCWTDNYQHLSYITYTVHWIDSNWKLQSGSLGTCHFSPPHTGEDIKKILKILFLSTI
uniref:Uncharacterized protein n=1 Tax=Strigamia maritima TaxID=126957 RepID=T1IUS5_STRMM